MAAPVSLRDWVSQIAQLEGFNAQGHEYGQSLDTASMNPITQKMFKAGVTPDQAAQSWKSWKAYDDFISPFQGVGSTGNRGDQEGVITPQMQQEIDAGKVAWDPNANAWVATDKAGFGKPNLPAQFAGTSMWSKTDYLKDPNLQFFRPDLGTYTVPGNIKQPKSDWWDQLSGALPLLLMAPALGALSPGLSGLVGLGSSTFGSGGKPNPGMLLNLLKLFAPGG